MTLGGAAQVAAAHCLNERILDPAVYSYNRPSYAPASCTMAISSPSNVLRQRLTIYSIQHYRILIATHLPTLDGWNTELA